MAGRPRVNRESIVPADQIMNVAAIRQEVWRFDTLCREFADLDTGIMWLARRRLLANTWTCGRCESECRLHQFKGGIDGKRWACPICKYRQSIREGSFFARSHLSLKQIMLIVYCWSYDLRQHQIMHEANIDSRRTVIDWCNFCREECSNYMDRVYIELGGFDDTGEPVVVEVAEPKYFHCKYHRGPETEGYWVFGAVERVSGRCVFPIVPNTTTETLLPLIRQHILPGTHIISDGWSSFENLIEVENSVYHHSVVNRKQKFDEVDPDIHTHNVKNLWLRAKRKIGRYFGTSNPLFPSYLREFEYRSSVLNRNVFGHFLVCLAENYSVSKPGGIHSNGSNNVKREESEQQNNENGSHTTLGNNLSLKIEQSLNN